MSEIRYSSMQLVEQGRLEGVVMRYGELGQGPGGMPERFLPGAFGDVTAQDIILNSMHLRPFPLARTGGGGLRLTDSSSLLGMTADLKQTQPGREALEQVKAGILRGLSVEFTALQERQAGNVREIVRARLVDLGLVDRAAYPGSLVHARRLETRASTRLTTLRGNVPAGKVLACRCSPGKCAEAVFKSGALDDALSPDSDRDVLTVIGEYAAALGSVRRNSLRFWSDGKGGLEVALDVPDTSRGRAFMDTFESVDTYARPSLDLDASVFETINAGRRAVYDRARVRAMVLGPTDFYAGWQALRRAAGPDDDRPGYVPGAVVGAVVGQEEERARPRRRRIWL